VDACCYDLVIELNNLGDIIPFSKKNVRGKPAEKIDEIDMLIEFTAHRYGIFPWENGTF